MPGSWVQGRTEQGLDLGANQHAGARKPRTTAEPWAPLQAMSLSCVSQGRALCSAADTGCSVLWSPWPGPFQVRGVSLRHLRLSFSLDFGSLFVIPSAVRLTREGPSRNQPLGLRTPRSEVSPGPFSPLEGASPRELSCISRLQEPLATLGMCSGMRYLEDRSCHLHIEI